MDILTGIDDDILTITFNRAAKKNAITAAMYQALADALHAGENDPAVRVMLIVGQPEIFTAGNDLDDFLHAPPHGGDSPVFRFLHIISTAQKPIVAVVRGAAVGVGTTLLLHCDLVYAGRSARFSLPFVQLGLCPEAASSLLLPQLIGYRQAAAKLLLGEPFGADEALAIGFVNEVLDDDVVLAHAEKQARKPRRAADDVAPHDEVADEGRRRGRRRRADGEGRHGVSRDAGCARGARGVLGVLREAEAGLQAIRLRGWGRAVERLRVERSDGRPPLSPSFPRTREPSDVG